MSDLATELENLAELERNIASAELQITELAAAVSIHPVKGSTESTVALEAAQLALEAFHERRRLILYVVDDLSRNSLP